MNKLEGIKALEELGIPTVKILDISKIIKGEIPINEKGLSIRTSPKDEKGRNVYLPSIHGCKDINKIKKFIEENQKYNIFAHETVNPEIIGSISKIKANNMIIIETYKDFENRKNEKIENRVSIPIYNDKLWISKLEMLNKDENDFYNFEKVIRYLRYIPYNEYDAEFVIENRKVIFTELTFQKERESELYI